MKLTVDQARTFLVGHHGLAAVAGHGAAGIRACLRDRRCIQLDPLDKIGTNADLVAIARVDGVRRGDVHRELANGHAFEHFAKERCLLPASAFPYYRDQAAETPWWRLSERLKRLPDGILDEVLAEITERGPIAAEDLADRGKVERMDWSGWKGTGKAATMAIEVLWTRCQIVTAGRTARGRLYDVPHRALPDVHALPADRSFAEWAVIGRVEAAGLLSTTAGAHWSMLAEVRTGDLPDQLVRQKKLEKVTIEGSPRTYLAPAGFLDRSYPDLDDRMRILGPLDPLIWDRKLTSHVFGFDYVWEVYKPAAKRLWGWYVVPLLHRGHLVGRMEAHVEGSDVVVDQQWAEDGVDFDRAAFASAIDRHAAAM